LHRDSGEHHRDTSRNHQALSNLHGSPPWDLFPTFNSSATQRIGGRQALLALGNAAAYAFTASVPVIYA
jgi:hypothetical protein